MVLGGKGGGGGDGGGGDGLRARRLPRSEWEAEADVNQCSKRGLDHRPSSSSWGSISSGVGESFSRSYIRKSISKLPHLAKEDLAHIAHMAFVMRQEATVAATKAVAAVAQGANVPLSDFGRKWLDLRRKVPRFTFFPLLVLAFMVASCSWVLPTVFVSVHLAKRDKSIQQCYMMYDTLPPYNANNRSATSLVADAQRGCYVDQGGVATLIDATVPNFRSALTYMAPALVAGMTHGDASAAAYWDTQMPELRFLGCVATLKPQGTINPVNGIMDLVLQWSTSTSYPLNVPLSSGTMADPETGLQRHARFRIEWHVTCNGGSAVCASDETCGVLLVNCNAYLVAEVGHSLSMYPWDRYFFPADISVHALVENLETGKVQRVGVPMLFSFEQSTSTYYINQEFSSEEVRSAGLEPQQQVYLFPPRYDNAAANSLQLLTVFRLERAFIVMLWSVLLLMVTWALAVGLLVMVLDLYWRPHDMFNGMQYSVLGLLPTLIFLRNVQPDVPPIGVVIDVGGLLWTWLIVAISGVICMATAYGQYHHGDAVRKKKKLEEDRAHQLQAAREEGASTTNN